MGCDYYADEEGKFQIQFVSYDTGRWIGWVIVEDLEPNERVRCDLISGKER